jgi:hypothetical protein
VLGSLLKPMSRISSYIAVIVLVVAACRPPAPQEFEQGAPISATAQADSQAVTSGRYGVRSGILTAITDLPALGSVGQTVITFDQYGAVERNETVVAVKTAPGRTDTARYVSITNGTFLYTLLPDERVAKRVSLVGQSVSSPASIDFCALDSAGRARNNISLRGTDTVLGRPCTVYIVRDKQSKNVGTYYVWQCIPLKIDVDMQGTRMVMQPQSFVENVTVDPSLFDIPAGYTVLDSRP